MKVTEDALCRVMGTGRFALVGAGQLGNMALSLWPAGVEKPRFLLDSKKRGSLQGIEIRDLASHQPVEGLTYLLSAFKMPVPDVERIFTQLHQPMILTVYDLFEHYSPAVLSNGWRNLRADKSIRARVAALPRYFADEQSAAVTDAVSAWRYDRVLTSVYPVGLEDLKYNLDLFGRRGMHYDLVYDGGAFNLGLIDHLGYADISFARYLAFEPDPLNRGLCERKKAALDDRQRKAVSIYGHPLYDAPGSYPFLANGQLSARIVREGAPDPAVLIDVDAVTLDDVHRTAGASGERVLIKLHVEAAEPMALTGARKLIEETKSDILVNLSHDERSLLEIPAYLASFRAHDLFLRSHSLFGEGLTLFARYKD